jgi:Ca2+-binding RTX toxin-like protein
MGRDLLIGGAGIDALRGNAGDDILVAGPSAFDDPNAANVLSLRAILAEWSRTDAAYAVRIARISGSIGGGLNGTNALQPGVTVTDDAHNDTLHGESGIDWYIANRLRPGTVRDTVTGWSWNETFTEL